MFAADSHKTQQACAESSIINIPLAEWIVGTRRRPGDDLNRFFWVLIFIWSRTSWRACWAAPGARVRCGSWWTQEVVEVSPINRGPEPTPGSSREGSVFKKLITLLTADRLKGTVCHFCCLNHNKWKVLVVCLHREVVDADWNLTQNFFADTLIDL